MKRKSQEAQPWLSIIIPHKGAVEAACRTIVSARDPRVDPLVEIHVQDALSPAAEVAAMRACDPGVRVASEADDGIYDAINRGIRATTGRYVLVLGAGDRLRPGALAEVLGLLRGREPVALYGDVFMEDLAVRYRGEFQPRDFFLHNICQQGLFYGRGVFEELGYFRLEFPWLADYEFNVRLFARHWERIHYWPGIVADYRGGGASITRWREDPFVPLRKDFVAAAFGIERKPKRPRKG